MAIDNETEFNLELMADLLSKKDQFSIKSEFDELDHIPLKERMMNLRRGRDALETEIKRPNIFPYPIVMAVKTEKTQSDPQRIFEGQSASFHVGEVKDGKLSSEQSSAIHDRVPERNADSVSKELILALPAACYAGEMESGKSSVVQKKKSDRTLEGNPFAVCNVGADNLICSEKGSTYQSEDLPNNYSAQETQSAIPPEVEKDTTGLKQLDRNICCQSEQITSSIPIQVKVEHSDNYLTSPHSKSTVFNPIAVKTEINDEPGTEELDHIPLKQRQRRLLSRQSFETMLQLHTYRRLEEAPGESSVYPVAGISNQNASKAEEESHPVEEYPLISEFFKTSTLNFPNSGAGLSHTIPESSSLETSNTKNNILPVPSNLCGTQENNSSSHMTPTDLPVPTEQEGLPAGPINMALSSLTSFAVQVKLEEVENELESPCSYLQGISSINKMLDVKGESGVSWDDELDHMPLRERRKLLISSKVSNLDEKCLQKVVPPLRKCNSGNSKKAMPRAIHHQRKRKRTATDSVETALEEDAPGLLQVLIDKGILVDEIKLYGDMESDDPLDSLFEEDSFGDLEAVISKLFTERVPLFKFAPIRGGKGSKASYCLACLISLVEQSRYLQSKKWPVEWGWCRDLQSFIFVFKRHNRIVLERPEYGYATYFFELVDSLPVDWQVKRLVTAMKLPSCRRTTIVENRALLIGEDLTEGEARVLEEYGWIPNTGLGSMLNYCDRVVHDQSNERDGTEWRSKIGKILVDGLKGGNIVLNSLPKRVMAYADTSNSQIKLEL